MIAKMPGDEWQRFANLRALYGYMFTHPGKKLLFMGNEIGQWREWNADSSLDWHLLEYPFHRGLQQWVRDLNLLLRKTPALHELDFEPRGFQWIDCSDTQNSVISILRLGTEPADSLLVVCHFTPLVHRGYRVGVPTGGDWRERLNSDAVVYGGSGQGNLGAVTAAPIAAHGRPHSLSLTLPPLSMSLFQCGAGDVGQT